MFVETIDNLMEELAGVGISVTDARALRDLEANGDAWQATFMELVRTGRKQGVRFTRSSTHTPTDEQLHQMMGGYGFSSMQVQQFISNLASTNIVRKEPS